MIGLAVLTTTTTHTGRAANREWSAFHCHHHCTLYNIQIFVLTRAHDKSPPSTFTSLSLSHTHTHTRSSLSLVCCRSSHTYIFGRLLVIDPLAVEEEPPSVEVNGALLAVRVENLLTPTRQREKATRRTDASYYHHIVRTYVYTHE